MFFSLLLLLVLDDDESLTIIGDDNDDGDDLAKNCCRRNIDLLPLLTPRILRYSILLIIVLCVCVFWSTEIERASNGLIDYDRDCGTLCAHSTLNTVLLTCLLYNGTS